MKLSRLYANEEGVFPPIRFNSGLNVVFAKVKSPLVKSNDSHNLGKTFLISVLDFCLLGSIDKDHPFKTEPEFEQFIFFLELEVKPGLFVTVRRQVTGRNAVCIQSNKTGQSDYIALSPEDWEFPNLSIQKATKVLNELLNLTGLQDYGFRKGLGYVLRRQADYDEVFRLTRFSRGKDVDWKPFVAMLLGFKHETIRQKHELDLRIDELEKLKKQIEEQAQMGSGEIDKLTGLIELRERDTARLRKQVNDFDFYELEDDISHATVDEIEATISELNKERYQLQSRLRKIEKSLESNFEFEPERIRQLFDEVGVVLPEPLVKSYDELVEFNRRLTSGRTDRLRGLQADSTSRLLVIAENLESLNASRKNAMVALQEKETLEKYKRLVERLREDESEIAELRERLVKLDSVSSIDTQRDSLVDERTELARKIRTAVRRGNVRYKAIREYFSTAFEGIVDAYAVMSVSTNKQDNLEFQVQTLDRSRGNRTTREGEGHSYKKMLCVCFDLALIRSYSMGKFYRFVYHDGVFEALDNRKKVGLVELIRDNCESEGLQYILTVADTDLPRDESDSKQLFNSEEIIRELHDDGNDGRLFRMRKF